MISAANNVTGIYFDKNVVDTLRNINYFFGKFNTIVDKKNEVFKGPKDLSEADIDTAYKLFGSVNIAVLTMLKLNAVVSHTRSKYKPNIRELDLVDRFTFNRYCIIHSTVASKSASFRGKMRYRFLNDDAVGLQELFDMYTTNNIKNIPLYSGTADILEINCSVSNPWTNKNSFIAPDRQVCIPIDKDISDKKYFYSLVRKLAATTRDCVSPDIVPINILKLVDEYIYRIQQKYG